MKETPKKPLEKPKKRSQRRREYIKKAVNI